MDETVQDYLILLRDNRVLPIRLRPSTVTAIADEQQRGRVAGAYPAFNAADEPFTCMLHLPEVVAVTHARLSMDDLDRTLTASQLIKAFRRGA